MDLILICIKTLTLYKAPKEKMMSISTFLTELAPRKIRIELIAFYQRY